MFSSSQATSSKFISQKGSSLLDVLVGSAIMVVVFTGFLAVLQVGTKLSFDNKARIGATALAGERMEYIRSLAYTDIGTAGGIPSGNLEQTENVSLNNIKYIRRTLVQYVDAPQDGEGDADENGITADYKRTRVEVSWVSHSNIKKVVLVSNFSPVSIESLAGGGSLSISVFDASVTTVESAEVRIVNNQATLPIDVTTYTNSEGKVLFPGSPAAASYEITVTKNGFSTDKTYDADPNNPNPDPGHLTVAESLTTSKDFFIDLLGSLIIKTYEQIKEYEWEDLFNNSINIATSTNTEVLSGKLTLTSGAEGYALSGSSVATSTSHQYIYAWKEVSWNDTKPAGTNISYHIYDGSLTLIPDTDLPGNASGFSTSPLNISNLATSTYPELSIGANLTTTSTTTTPTIEDWKIVYEAGPIPLPNVNFDLRGNKTIGDNGGVPVYKYSTSTETTADSIILFPTMEWDQYEYTLTESGWDIAEACEPFPINLQPAQDLALSLYLTDHTTNTLLTDVRDSNGILLEGALVDLTRNGFQATSTSSSCGQSFFRALTKAADYVVTVSKTGYQTAVENNVDINGQSRSSVILNAE